MIYWFTGQPGHGKTTLAEALIAQLRRLGYAPHHIDGDDLRNITCNKDYSDDGRVKNVSNAQNIACFFPLKDDSYTFLPVPLIPWCSYILDPPSLM